MSEQCWRPRLGHERIVVKFYWLPRKLNGQSMRSTWAWGRCRVVQELVLEAGDWFMHKVYIDKRLAPAKGE